MEPGSDGRRLLALKFVAALILVYTPDPNSSTEPPSNLAGDAPKDRIGETAPEEINRKDSGETPAAGKLSGDRKPSPKLAGGDRKFRRTQPLDRHRPEASPYAQKLENQEEPVETNKPTTGEGAADGSRRPKVHRTSSNPPMTTPSARTSLASSWVRDLSPDVEKRETGGWGRGASRWLLGGPPMTGEGGTAATKAWPDCGGRRERGTGPGVRLGWNSKSPEGRRGLLVDGGLL
ncbi:hypothetical protein Cgig2_018489 [Carnegiea gigantea]|uniref:Uncharacterized protein n=1 Tax=Carnegiea gigantea TaxID=171969 RepID=A0A9Q1GM18_9CARY|nr:hypothetical protein Cgig2_018489 [Carnegiea gigantea]